jgi:hypothetical protein
VVVLEGVRGGAQKVPCRASGSESPPRVHFWLALGGYEAEKGCVNKVHLVVTHYRLLLAYATTLGSASQPDRTCPAGPIVRCSLIVNQWSDQQRVVPTGTPNAGLEGKE